MRPTGDLRIDQLTIYMQQRKLGARTLQELSICSMRTLLPCCSLHDLNVFCRPHTPTGVVSNPYGPVLRVAEVSAPSLRPPALSASE